MKSLNTFFFCFFMVLCVFQNVVADITLPKPVQDYLKTGRIAEDKTLSSYEPTYSAFIEYLRKHWRDVLSNIQTIAPSDNEKCKIVLGCEALPDDQYLAFLQKIEELFAQHRIDMTVVESALDGSAARSGFLADNWKNPAVRSLMAQFRNLIPAGHYLKSYPDKVLSGKAKEEKDDGDRMSNEKPPSAVGAQPGTSSTNSW